MEALNKKYLHNDVEKDQYDKWLKVGLFSEENNNNNKPIFSVLLPPPNITGKLHLGHALNNTLQDVIVRYKKLQGFHITWFPGMDHAGIATQIKVEERLWTEFQQKRRDFSRKEFINQVHTWQDEYMLEIRNQWKKLGLALDYRYEKFTLDTDVSNLVNDTFIKLYEDGLIYRGKKIINWDPKFQTALSNMEVIYKEVLGKMYYIKYQIENSPENVIIATTRPETMFADQALVFNPQDLRYQHLVGQRAINPANNEAIPIITDSHVEMDFGTGIMKCTPAHDFNDYEIGIRNNLPLIVCMNPDGTMNEIANGYVDLDRFVCREKLIVAFKNNNALLKIEDYTHQVGFSERSDVIIEPYLSEQWFVKMAPLALRVTELQDSKEAVIFYPERFSKVLEQWLNNIHDWCISRQLWWGHQLPVWYHRETNEMIVTVTPPNIIDWIQDEDVLDTWFSSGLWPIIFSQNHQEHSKENPYLPSSLLVTGYDIIFFWVSRMQCLTLYLADVKPFNEVIMHGLIRDEQGKKMSKSLGNGIDPMDVIAKYGTDSLRFFLLTNTTPGQDLRYSETKVRSAWNFINKLWNASRYVLMNWDPTVSLVDEITSLDLNDADLWILNRLNFIIEKVQFNLLRYEFVVIGKYLFDFVWDDFCSWYIELSKKSLDNVKTRGVTLQVLFYVLKQINILLHPLVPFVTDKIYQQMFGEESYILQDLYPSLINDLNETQYIKQVIDLVTVIREFRATKNLKKSIPLEFNLNSSQEIYQKYQQQINDFLKFLTNAEIISFNNKISQEEVMISLVIYDGTIDVYGYPTDEAEQKINLNQEIAHLKSEIIRSETILSNVQFLEKAPLSKVKDEKDKYERYKLLLEDLEKKLALHN